MGWQHYQNQNALALAYTYEDEAGAPIDLTGYASVVMLVVPPDEAEATQPGTSVPAEEPATFDADRTTGLVTLDYEGIDTPGLWQFQAKCTPADVNARPLYGVPLQLNVAANLDD